MITIEQRTKLEELGFYIEDMQEVWGSGWWNGMFRWMRNTDEFQDYEPSESEDLAWACAWAYANSMGYV